jgi:hypothetical protein
MPNLSSPCLTDWFALHSVRTHLDALWITGPSGLSRICALADKLAAAWAAVSIFLPHGLR